MEPFPLQWPVGYPRTANPEVNGQFRNISAREEIEDLMIEIKRLKAQEVIVSCNIPIRKNGVDRDWDYPRKKIQDNGVAIYFKLDGVSQVLSCDAWHSLEHNLRALTKTIEALRGLDRWKASEILKRAFSGLKELPETAESLTRWWEILGVGQKDPPGMIKTAYRQLAYLHHPDQGGDSYQFSRINEAWEKAKKERGI